MMASILILGALSMQQPEPSLSLEAVSSVENGNILVTARLRNRGEKPVVVVVDDYFCRIETLLYDMNGTLLEPRDRRATTCNPFSPEVVKPATLAPGDVVEVVTFEIVVGYSNARSGPLSWEVQDLAGQTLKVGFSYEFSAERLTQVEKIGAPGAVAGTWTSPTVDVATEKLKQQQVNNILSSRRRILDVAVIPLLVEALVNEKDEVIREWAAVSLGELKAMAAAPALTEVLRTDPARVVRVCAARALGEIAAPESRGALTETALDDSDSLVRISSEDALKKLPR